MYDNVCTTTNEHSLRVTYMHASLGSQLETSQNKYNSANMHMYSEYLIMYNIVHIQCPT